LKTLLKAIALVVAIVCLTIIAAFTALTYWQQSTQPPLKTYMIIQPENAAVDSVQTPIIPSNQSYVIVEAEQASLSKNNQQVNVTVIRTSNETQASLLFQTVKSSFLAQEFAPKNLTSPYPAIELDSTERPTIILIEKGNYVAICQSNDLNLALEAANAQLNITG
jgi:hypothetical protein